jgi:hypothetical protein
VWKVLAQTVPPALRDDELDAAAVLLERELRGDRLEPARQVAAAAAISG